MTNDDSAFDYMALRSEMNDIVSSWQRRMDETAFHYAQTETMVVIRPDAASYPRRRWWRLVRRRADRQ